MKRRALFAVLLMAGFLASSGCPRSGETAQSAPAQPAASPAKPPAPAKPSGTGGTGGIGAPNIPWAQKTHAQRQDYMGLYVLPRMEKLFKEWRPDDYGGFRCQN